MKGVCFQPYPYTLFKTGLYSDFATIFVQQNNFRLHSIILTGSSSSVESVHSTVVCAIVEECLEVGQHSGPPVAILAVWVRLKLDNVCWERLGVFVHKPPAWLEGGGGGGQDEMVLSCFMELEYTILLFTV